MVAALFGPAHTKRYFDPAAAGSGFRTEQPVAAASRKAEAQ
jgi:hypothetical protein